MPAPRVVAGEGKIQLDVVVTDAADRPVMGLQPWNFKILDDNQPRRVLTFNAFDGVVLKAEPPVEVVLLIDTANLPFQQVAFVRGQVETFLRANGGRLRQPVRLILMTDTGIRIQPRASTDGNALAQVVRGIQGSVGTLNAAMGSDGLVERFQISVREMASIAENLALRPGRKLLIWVAPGWPMLDRHVDGDQTKNRRRYFDAIVEISTRLREARTVVYSVAPQDASVNGGRATTLYRDFLKGVRSPMEADAGNLALKVIATQTGGLVLGPDNDVAGQIELCVEEANAFYRISFDPPRANQSDEYHGLRVQVDRPGVSVRTRTGYYDEP